MRQYDNQRSPTAIGSGGGERSTSLVSTILAAAAALAMSGCAGIDNPLAGLGAKGGGEPAGTPAAIPALPSGDGPAAPTAVVETAYSVDGAIMPVMRGQSRTATRADMRREDSQVSFDNWLMRTVTGDGRSAGITRVDRKLVWQLEPARRQYTECAITGCATPTQPSRGSDEKADSKRPSEPGCPVSVRLNELKVTPTGERRMINGFSTEGYNLAWTIALEDNQGRRNSNRIQLDLWNAPETGPVRDVQQIDETYQRRYLAALGSGENPVGRYVPRNVIESMGAFIKGMDAKDAKTLQAMASELRKIRGYPIRTTMSWTMEGSVCSDAAMPTGGGAGGLSGMLGALTGNRASAGSSGPSPMIVFESEVKTLGVRPVGDDAFVPPSDYTRR